MNSSTIEPQKSLAARTNEVLKNLVFWVRMTGSVNQPRCRMRRRRELLRFVAARSGHRLPRFRSRHPPLSTSQAELLRQAPAGAASNSNSWYSTAHPDLEVELNAKFAEAFCQHLLRLQEGGVGRAVRRNRTRIQRVVEIEIEG